jgi:hypothetical protein
MIIACGGPSLHRGLKPPICTLTRRTSSHARRSPPLDPQSDRSFYGRFNVPLGFCGCYTLGLHQEKQTWPRVNSAAIAKRRSRRRKRQRRLLQRLRQREQWAQALDPSSSSLLKPIWFTLQLQQPFATFGPDVGTPHSLRLGQIALVAFSDRLLPV